MAAIRLQTKRDGRLCHCSDSGSRTEFSFELVLLRALAAADAFATNGLTSVLELGTGQGRDTLFLARFGLRVAALDYASGAVETIPARAEEAGLADLVTVARHDIRQPLPLPDSSVDASYSHTLFCMALTTPELERLAAELHRVVRPGGLVVYTARTTADATTAPASPAATTCSNTAGSSSTSSTGV